jgi:hypothetical protein
LSIVLGLALASCGGGGSGGAREGGANDARADDGGAGASGGAAGNGTTGGGGAGASGHAGTGGASGSGGAGGHAGGGGAGGKGGATCGTATCNPGGQCCYACISLCAAAGETCPVFIQDPCATATDAGVGAGQCSDKHPACPGGEVCDLSQPGRCTASTVSGTCITKPMACPLDYLPVCGCDGKTYGNDCERQAAGAQLDHAGPCV